MSRNSLYMRVSAIAATLGLALTGQPADASSKPSKSAARVTVPMGKSTFEHKGSVTTVTATKGCEGFITGEPTFNDRGERTDFVSRIQLVRNPNGTLVTVIRRNGSQIEAGYHACKDGRPSIPKPFITEANAANNAQPRAAQSARVNNLSQTPTALEVTGPSLILA